MSIEGNEAMSPSFTTSYIAIKASSASPEVLIASLLPTGGTAKEAIFPMAINHLSAVGSLFSCANGKRAMPPSCALIDTYNTL